MSRILFILTSHDFLLNGEPTGLWLEEHAVPYVALTGVGHEVTVASVAGGDVPVDAKSIPRGAEAHQWADAAKRLRATPGFDQFDASQFDAVFLPGGHGTMFDMPYNRRLHDLLFQFEALGKVIAAVCHAPAVFAGMRRRDGTAFIAGRNITGFTDAEEVAADCVSKLPFQLESRLKALGAIYHAAPNWTSNVIQDGSLITGQNPHSSAEVAARLNSELTKA
jgi:putative intracellular protease/amidase